MHTYLIKANGKKDVIWELFRKFTLGFFLLDYQE